MHEDSDGRLSLAAVARDGVAVVQVGMSAGGRGRLFSHAHAADHRLPNENLRVNDDAFLPDSVLSRVPCNATPSFGIVIIYDILMAGSGWR